MFMESDAAETTIDAIPDAMTDVMTDAEAMMTETENAVALVPETETEIEDTRP